MEAADLESFLPVSLDENDSFQFTGRSCLKIERQSVIGDTPHVGL